MILLTFASLNITSCRFFYWGPITCIWIEFFLMSLNILCIRSKAFFQMFSNSNLISWLILVNNSVLLTKMFQIVQRSSLLSLIPSNLSRIEIFHLINYSLYWGFILVTFVDRNNSSCIFFSLIQITCIWLEFVQLGLYILHIWLH